MIHTYRHEALSTKKSELYRKITKLAKLGKYKEYNELMRRFERCEAQFLCDLEKDINKEMENYEV